MTKNPFFPPSYHIGMPDMSMQIGYFPFGHQSMAAQSPVVVEIPIGTAMSSQCRYYLGQTEPLAVSEEEHALAALVNPYRSGVNLYLSLYSITNFSTQPLQAQIWFGRATMPGKTAVSARVTPGNLQLSPCPRPHGQIRFATGRADTPGEGVAAASRIVPPHSTVSMEKAGHWIIGPGMALMIYLPGTRTGSAEADVAFGWWEQGIYG